MQEKRHDKPSTKKLDTRQIFRFSTEFFYSFFRANPKMVPLFGFIHLWARLSRANLLYRLVLDPLNITRNSLELNIPFQSMFLVWCWSPSKINIFGNFMFLIINSNMNILIMTPVIVSDRNIIICCY